MTLLNALGLFLLLFTGISFFLIIFVGVSNGVSGKESTDDENTEDAKTVVSIAFLFSLLISLGVYLLLL